MKTGYKIVLVIFSIIIVSELIQYLTKNTFFKKYVTTLNEENRAYIDSASKLAGLQTNQIPTDYLTVLNRTSLNDTNKISFIKTIQFKFRPPVSEFIFSKKYLIQISRIDTATIVNLETAVFEQNVEAGEETNVGYAIEHNGFLKYEYNNSQRPKPSKIFLTIEGVQTLLLKKTDSTAYYFSNLKNMSIHYNNLNSNQDLLISTVASNVPVEILFCKKNSNLYLIIATNNKEDSILDKNLLYNLIYK